MHYTTYLRSLQDDSLTSIADVREALETLNELLQDTNLSTLQNFNKAYLIITKNVQRKLYDGFFDDPVFLETFDIRFVHYYFRALRSYIDGKTVPQAWHTTFERCQRQSASPLKAMALGVNAHVNNDIAQVLFDCQAQDEHRNDYNRVNAIIRDSIYETIDNLEPNTARLNPTKRYLKPAYKFAMNILIRVWRAAAWRNYQRINHRQYNISQLERYADMVARGTQKLPI